MMLEEEEEEEEDEETEERNGGEEEGAEGGGKGMRRRRGQEREMGRGQGKERKVMKLNGAIMECGHERLRNMKNSITNNRHFRCCCSCICTITEQTHFCVPGCNTNTPSHPIPR